MEYRLETQYRDESARFILKDYSYREQYCHIYVNRLKHMKDLFLPLVQKRWGHEYPLKKLCDLREDQPETCIVIGTIYKDQAHKPSILREISERNQLAPQPERLHYADSASDKIIIEDELQRARLCGKVSHTDIATGVVCAVMGTVENGRFDVEDILYYESGPQTKLPPASPQSKGRLLVLASGLNKVQSAAFEDSLNLFQYFLGGVLKLKGGHGQLVRLIVAGNSVRTEEKKAIHPLHVTKDSYKDTVTAVQQLDEIFHAWSKTLPVDVMPGPYDPGNYLLPQQPFHQCMFPLAAKLESFRCVSNPYACSLDDCLTVVGTSGQNIEDLLRNTMLQERLDALRHIVRWGHLAPTAPDTLSCYPFLNEDPYILRECPHILFSGNCPQFETALHKGPDGQETRLICVPNFSLTKSIAVVNLDNLECHEISFDIDKE